MTRNKRLNVRGVLVLGLLLGISGFFLVAANVPATNLPQGALTSPPEGPEWINLIDEDHAPGWLPSIRRTRLFEIKDSALHLFGTEDGGYVCYATERLRDFELHIEFKLTANTNSGVILRGEMEDPTRTGVEIQVLDDYGRDPNRYSCGALYDVVTPMFNMSMPTGQWNSFDISFKGRILVVYLNGWKILDVDLSKMVMPLGSSAQPYANRAPDGFLFLQDFGHEIWYRRILLKKL